MTHMNWLYRKIELMGFESGTLCFPLTPSTSVSLAGLLLYSFCCALATETLWEDYSYLAGLMGKKSLCMQIASLWRGLCCISVLCHILTDLLWLCEVKVNEAGRSFWLNKCLLTQYFLIICLCMQREIILKPCFCQFYDIEQVLFAGLLKLFTCCYCL